MKNTAIIIIVLLAIVATTSCRHKHDITCTDAIIVIHPVGFTSSDFTGARVVRYKQDNTFSLVIDSTSATDYTSNGSNNDTANFSAYTINRADSLHANFIVPGFDYRIMLPAIGRVVSLTGIVQGGNTHQTISSSAFDKKYYVCYNGVVHASVDGKIFTGDLTAPYIPIEIVK